MWLQLGQGALEGSRLRRFYAVALKPSSSSSLFAHAPGIACNCTRLPAGRALLMEGAAGDGLSALVATLQSPTDVRRSGAAAAIKNVVMGAPLDGTQGKVLQDTERLRQLLVRPVASPVMPLAICCTGGACLMHQNGFAQAQLAAANWRRRRATSRCMRPTTRQGSYSGARSINCAVRSACAAQAPINGEPPTEHLDAVREDLATTAAFLCRSEEGRKALMAAGGHESLKKGYEHEEHAGTMAAMEEAARALMGVQLDDGQGTDAADGGVIMVG